MRTGRPKTALILTDEERQQLTSLAHRSRTAAGPARRARIILACAGGQDNKVVARRLHLSQTTVCKWRARFLEQRMAGLQPAGVLCEILDDNGDRATRDTLVRIARRHHLHIITIEDLIAFRQANEQLVTSSAVAELPTRFGHFRIHAFDVKFEAQQPIALVMGGALGNLHDRLFRMMETRGEMRHGVVDFIKVFYWPGKEWPTFNVADVALVVGVGLLFVFLSKHGDALDKKKAAEAGPAKPGEEKAASGA